MTGETLEGSTATAKAGYSFVGWYNGETKVGNNATLTPEDALAGLNTDENGNYAATTFTAKFTENSNVTLYYITEDADKGSVAPGSESLSPATGEAKGSTATPAAGYKFKNWTVDGEEVSTSATITKDAIDKVAKASGAYVETTFTANFEPDEKQTAAVTYTAQTGGSVTNEGDTIQIVTANGLEGSEAKAAAGYRFAGWYKGETQITEAEVLSKETAKANLNTDADTGRYADTTFVAKFEPNPEATVLVSYVSEDETKGTNRYTYSDEIQIVTGETLEGSTAAAKAGYEFTGWYKGNDLVTSDESLSPAVAKAALDRDENNNYAATTFTAKFAIDEDETVPVSYVSEDEAKGTVTNGDGDTIQIVTGETLEGSTATAKAGYSFVGWYNGETQGREQCNPDTEDALAGLNTDENGNYAATTFTAKFTENSNVTLYYITEDADKGSVAPGSESLSPATGESKGSTATPAAGYKFKNWTVDGEEVSTSATITKDAIDKVAKASGAYVETTFTANFEPDEKQTAAVTYTAQTGGSVTNEGDTIQIVTANGLEGSEAKAAAGYRFAGWYKGETQITEAEVLSKETAKANLNTDADTGRYADTTFVAKFEPNPEATVLVSYVSEDETKGTVTNGDGDEIQIVTGETLEGSTAAAKAGYEFTGWYKGNDLVTSDESLSPAVAKAALDRDENNNYAATTFTAKFAIDEDETVPVSYVSEDEAKGTVTNGDGDTIQIVTGETLEGSTATAKAGYSFVGWYNGETKVGNNATLTPEDALAGLNTDENGNYAATTFTAKFTENSNVTLYYITEDADKGSVAPGSESLSPATERRKAPRQRRRQGISSRTGP